MLRFRREEVGGNLRRLYSYKEKLLLFTENYLEDKLEDQTGRACGTNAELKMNTKFQSENVEEDL
jgi:hypothetical protein